MNPKIDSVPVKHKLTPQEEKARLYPRSVLNRKLRELKGDVLLYKNLQAAILADKYEDFKRAELKGIVNATSRLRLQIKEEAFVSDANLRLAKSQAKVTEDTLNTIKEASWMPVSVVEGYRQANKMAQAQLSWLKAYDASVQAYAKEVKQDHDQAAKDLQAGGGDVGERIKAAWAASKKGLEKRD